MCACVSVGQEKWEPTLGSFLGRLGLFRRVSHAAVGPCPGGVAGARGFIVAHLQGQKHRHAELKAEKN